MKLQIKTAYQLWLEKIETEQQGEDKESLPEPDEVEDERNN